MSNIERPTSPSNAALCTVVDQAQKLLNESATSESPATAMMSVDATNTVTANIDAAHNSGGRDGAATSPTNDNIESQRDLATLNEVARDTAAVLSTLDALGVDTLATNVSVMNSRVPMGGVGTVAGFLVHATDTRPVTDSAALNLSNAVAHTAIDTLVDGAFGGFAMAENALGSAATLMPVGSGGRAMLEGAQQVMPTAQVRGGLYAVADIQTAGQSAMIDAVRGEGPGGLYQSGDAIAESARAGDYGGVARLLQDSVDIVVPDQLGVPVAGTDFHFIADAR